jgi:hypothetical protein
MKVLALLAIVLSTGSPSCQGPTLPEPGETPRGWANSKILENIEFLRAREAATGRDSILVALGGASPITGTTCPDGVWWYRFAERPYYRLTDWQIGCDGQFVSLADRPDTLHLDMTEIAPVLNLDSDELIWIAREHGGETYLNRYPDARAGLVGRFVGRRPTWELRFSTLQVPCGFSALIDGQTGEVLLTSQPCP